MVEETGLTGIQLHDLEHRRQAEFLNHQRVLVRQTEHFFAARTNEVRLRAEGWTALEKAAVLSWRWWTVAELETTTATVYPENLPALVDRADKLV